MTSVVRLADHRRKPPYLHFTRPELNRLLGLYAGRVARGEWRDYAINLGADAARFMVFRHAHENPLYVISKIPAPRGRSKSRGQYVVHDRQRKLAQCQTLADALAVFDRPVRLVSG